MSGPYTAFRVQGGTLSLTATDVVQLLRSLHELKDPAADSIAEEIEVLQLAGVRVDLRPTDAETGALISAISKIIASSPGARPSFGRLLGLVRGPA